jgi:hypothetical protein
MADIGTFAGIGLALYAAHHVGDYWVQTDHQAAHKGAAGHEGVKACAAHVGTYVATQAVFLMLAFAVTGERVPWYLALVGFFVSGLTHYAADRREFGIIFRLARLITGKDRFLLLGVPRPPVAHHLHGMRTAEGEECVITITDNPSLGTGAWALDQSWHIALGVFLPALIMCF